MSKVLNILLQRNDTHYPWGFSIAGTPGALYIDKVSPGALSAQHLVVGDRLLQIAGIDSKHIDVWEAKDIVDQPQKSLELIVLKANQSSRRFSDGSESCPSSSGSVPWRRVRPASTISLDGRKAKNQFWERCSGLHSRDFYNSVDSDLYRLRDRHSRSHSVDRDSSTTPNSYSSNTDLYNYSVASEPLWAYKTGRRNISSNWDRTQSYTDESATLFPGNRIEKSDKTNESPPNIEKESSRGSSFSRQTSCPESESTKMFKEFSSYKPGKFPWFDNFDEFCSGTSSKKLDEEVSSSFSERSFLKSYNKKEVKSYQFEESSKKVSDLSKSSCNEQEKEYFYHKKGSFLEENSPSFDEINRSHTPAGFYENHKEEYLKSEHSVFDERGKSVEREEISRRSYSCESTVDRNSESVPSETKEEFSSSSIFSEPKSTLEKPSYYSNSVPKSDRNFSRTQSNSSEEQIYTNNNSSAKGSELIKDYELKTKTTETSSKSDESFKSSDEHKESSAECFSKCISNKENRSIFDARKYWSCTSPTSEAQFVFIPMQKPIPSTPAQKTSQTLQRVNEDQELTNDAIKITSVENEKSKKDTLQDDQSENNQRPYPSNMSSEPVPWRRQQNQISSGNSYSPAPPVFDSVPAAPPAAGVPLAPPPPPPPPSSGGIPPPPPPIGLVHIPAIRLKSEIPDVRREPPAAIQNAMMKDKKPFTYTPGGLDLSEIRSPRMQRRISRNAQADSTQGPPVQQTQQPSRPVSLPPSAAAAMQPQIAIPVFPPTSPNINHSAPPPPPAPPMNNIQSSPPPPPQPMAVPKSQPQRHPLPQQHNQNSGSIYVPPVEQSSQPRAQLGSLYIPPVQQPSSQQEYPSATPTPPIPSAHLNKAPTPWLSRQSQPQKEVPPWVNREDSTPSPVANPNFQNNQKQPQVHHQPQPQLQQQPRIIPIQIEGREPAQPNTRIIPITIEGTPPPKQNNNPPNFQQQQHYNQQPQQKYQQQQQQQQRWPVYVHNKFNPPSPSLTNENSNITNGRTPQSPQPNWGGSGDGSSSPAPVQSRSFRVLQKITDTDPVEGDQIDAPYNSQGVPVSQLRKLQLSDDDRALMNKVKTQVDEDNFLHTESEPRYRGAAIPSRAFRMLQNMTDAGIVPQGPNPNDNQLRSPNRRPTQQEAASPAQPYVHPSEQQVQEPRMYTGAAIPSRSFRMLQAMTGPDPSGRPDESDY